MKIRNNDLSNRSIDIDIADGVSIHLYKCEYDEFIKLLLPDMEQEIKNAYTLQHRAIENLPKMLGDGKRNSRIILRMFR